MGLLQDVDGSGGDAGVGSLDANIARKYTEDDLEQFWHFLTDEAIRLMELRNKTKPSAVIVVYDGYSYS